MAQLAQIERMGAPIAPGVPLEPTVIACAAMRNTVRPLQLIALVMSLSAGCGGASQSTESSTPSQHQAGEDPARSDNFQIANSETAGQAHGERPSEIEATRTHAAMRLFVVNPDTGPIPGIVIKMTAPDGTSYYTRETDSHGYGEVLVPVGQRYAMEYLSLGRVGRLANLVAADDEFVPLDEVEPRERR